MENKELSVAWLYHPSAFVTLNLLLRDAKSCLYLAHSEIHQSSDISTFEPLDILSCLQICYSNAATARM